MPDNLNNQHLTIGEFALQTGLTQRALRLYAERGILLPASVDPINGYRRYAPEQVRTGMLVRALREAAVPMAELADLDSFSIAEHRESLRRRRSAEDEALLVAEAIDGFDATDWPVTVTAAGPQAWAGVRITEDFTEDESGDAVLEALGDNEIANRCFGVLFEELAGRGNHANGVFWTAMDEGGDPGSVALTLAWPVPTDPREGDWDALVAAVGERTAGLLPTSLEVVAGVLPARRELSCRSEWPGEGADPAATVLSGMGPMLALQEHESAHAERPLSRTIRQRGVLGEEGMPTAQEMVLDVHP
ncbi:MerR family DNA-binding transcriptional regulator [Enemella evansiae]|uniref:MerR family DNA-binding transcriptional regulator n=1 Tax=Enemella evansiae TaxID=2016499 RepID=UPI000B97AB9D|nr:MerR family DNA-binding transcriptional regulator [Enemella evansiae]OYO12427.1 hypothetical protein BI335_14580 [Enemella evansiae]TDO93323.1 DNA-binding transcriptional MerR regulator [Enemella evansiae]